MVLCNNKKWILSGLVSLALFGCGEGENSTSPELPADTIDPNSDLLTPTPAPEQGTTTPSPETVQPEVESSPPTSDVVTPTPTADKEENPSESMPTPAVPSNEAPTLISQSTNIRADELFDFTLQSQDNENDSVSFSSSALPAWLTLDSKTGQLTGAPTMQQFGTHEVSITLSDTLNQQSFTFTINVLNSKLEEAIQTGNALLVNDENTYIDVALAEIESSKLRFNQIKSQLFNLDSDTQKLDAIDWDPTHDAAILTSQYPFNEPVLYTTHSTQSGGVDRVLPIAIAGSKTPESGRYLAFGGNPFRNNKNQQMDQFLLNSLTWLSGKALQNSGTFKVVFSQLDESQYFKDRSLTRVWFDTQLAEKVTYNAVGECDGVQLATCVASQPDVIVISRIIRDGDDKAAILAAIENALAQDIAVIYLQHDGGIYDHGRNLLNIFNISHSNDNYWWKLHLSGFDPQTLNDQLPTDITSIKQLLNNFKNKQFNVDLSGCATRACPAESNVQSEFFDGAQAVQGYFKSHDINKQDIFNVADFRLQKLLILLADKFRQTVVYPMDKLTTTNLQFFKSLYADHALYNYRDINPVQPDMGNFSRSDFSHIRPENKVVNLTSKPSFRSAGVYALPGQTLTVKRVDNSAVTTKVFINSLRSSATHIFSENKYNRPYFLQSQAIEVKPGETIKLTSSYGGPVQIFFNTKDLPVSFEFKNIGRHAYWSSPADDVMFATRMANADYDWAEIATAGFEVHSKLSKLNSSLANSIWPITSDFANATVRYTHNKVHVLAGFKGPGIDVEPEIHDFVTARGLTVDSIDIVKHMNADQPTCGWGCSGNPYDAGWNFSPTGHGDIHELGHGIERGSMRFEGYGGHSNTNFYSYFTKSIYEDETGQSASCQSLPFETIFNTLQASKNTADPSAYMQANLTKSWSEHHAIYIQLMMAVQAQGTLTNGWFLYPRLHIWDREMWRFDNSEESWNAGKVALGFDTYSLTEFNETSQNDRLYIALSEITELDLTDWFMMYGFEVSAKALTQVKSNAYPVLAQKFFTSSGTSYCTSLTQTAVNIDGIQVWPSE